MKVLCAIDGSAGSDAAVVQLGLLLSSDDEILLYYAPPTSRIKEEGGGDAGLADSLAERVFARAVDLLPADLRDRTKRLTGREKPRRGILSAAGEHHPDLIAVGARGTNRLGLAPLGSVSRAVVHGAEVPVLVARETGSSKGGPFEAMLACDPTELSGDTHQFLNRLTFPSDAVGRVVHVIESLFGDGLPDWLAREVETSTDPIARQFERRQEEEREEWIATLTEHCGRLPALFRKSAPVILKGHPGEQLTQYAKREGIDLLVVSTRSQGAIMRVLAGSTSEYILSNAACSVLVVPNHPS